MIRGRLRRSFAAAAWLGASGLLALVGCSRGSERTPQTVSGAAVAAAPGRPAPAAQASPADDGQWTMPAKNYAATRYSALDQINTTNVSRLGLAWTFSTGTTHGHEAPPLVVNNTMYVVTPYPNYVYALDLTKPGAPLKWK